MDKDLAQLKLSNGSEIVCEVIEWPDTDSNQLIIRNALQILAFEYHDEADRSYAFRPFVNFLENDDNYVIINTDHIISMNRPTEYLVEQYFIGSREVKNNIEMRLSAYKKDKLEGIRRLAESVNKLLMNRAEKRDMYSSSEDKKKHSNIIRFPSKDDIIH